MPYTLRKFLKMFPESLKSVVSCDSKTYDSSNPLSKMKCTLCDSLRSNNNKAKTAERVQQVQQRRLQYFVPLVKR